MNIDTAVSLFLFQCGILILVVVIILVVLAAIAGLVVAFTRCEYHILSYLFITQFRLAQIFH